MRTFYFAADFLRYQPVRLLKKNNYSSFNLPLFSGIVFFAEKPMILYCKFVLPVFNFFIDFGAVLLYYIIG